MRSNPKKNVLIALGWFDNRLLQGIAAYATERRWHLAAQSIIHERVIPWGWQGDGVLAWLAAGDDLAEFVLSVKKPTVDFSRRRAHLPFARVLQDHAQTGRLVAEHFLERGLRRFCFYSNMDNWSQTERGEGFIRALKEAGHSCNWLRWTDPGSGQAKVSWRQRRNWLLEHLRGVEKPAGIFTANGTLAVEVQELCEDAGLSVPGEIAIVGIDDYLLSVGANNRLISGVDTNLEEQGYRGAELLDKMMHGTRRPVRPVRVAPAGVITRKSSDFLAVEHGGVARVLQHMAEHLEEPLDVAGLAQAAGMSMRGLHQAFEDHLGTTPAARLRRLRMELAKQLLAGSTEKIEIVAGRCGYPSLNSFFIAFRRETGQTPASYRKATWRAR
ncbi:MAG: DNA-binding transcriptional regulator [Verrucomicrobiales bacterium]|nr:DNA-binding transcriptional regulator [Verrucomicrobiales bacterium]